MKKLMTAVAAIALLASAGIGHAATRLSTSQLDQVTAGTLIAVAQSGGSAYTFVGFAVSVTNPSSVATNHFVAAESTTIALAAGVGTSAHSGGSAIAVSTR